MSAEAIASAPATAPLRGKSQITPPGLERRGLELPPGQAKRAEGKESPAGVERRFAVAAPEPSADPEPGAGPAASVDVSA